MLTKQQQIKLLRMILSYAEALADTDSNLSPKHYTQILLSKQQQLIDYTTELTNQIMEP